MTTKVRLWFVRETEKARRYCPIPPDRSPTEGDMIWIPKSIIEHTTKYATDTNGWPIHIVTLPDWFVEKNL